MTTREMTAVIGAIKMYWPITEREWADHRKALAQHFARHLDDAGMFKDKREREWFVKTCLQGTAQ